MANNLKPKESREVFAEIKDGFLIVSVPVNEPLKLSSTGKNRNVASTPGSVTVPGFTIDGVSIVLSVMAYLPGTGEVPAIDSSAEFPFPEAESSDNPPRWSSVSDLIIESPWISRFAKVNEVMGTGHETPMTHPDDLSRFVNTIEILPKVGDPDTAEIAVWFAEATPELNFNQALDAELIDSREC